MVDASQSSRGRARRLILAGVGFWGRTWTGLVRESPHWTLAAVVDADETALEQAALAAGLPAEACFSSIAEASAGVEADAVLIVVPPDAHAGLALEALSCGLHCLVEKPFATTLADARAIVERAESVGRVVMVSQQYRYRAGARTVRGLVEAEAVGRIGAVYIEFANVLPVPGFQLEMAEPLLWDMAIHHFDLVRGVLGVEPVRVQATSFNPPWSEFGGNAAATVVFQTDGGIAITYTGSWAPRGRVTGWDGMWEILGESGSIRWDGEDVWVRPLFRPLIAKLETRAFRREWSGRRAKPVRIEEADRLGSLAEFSGAIREGRQPETNGRDNIRSLALTVAAVESARRGAAVDIAELLGDGHLSPRD